MESIPCGICENQITDKNDLGKCGIQGKETLVEISKDLKDGLAEKLKSMACPFPIHRIFVVSIQFHQINIAISELQQEQ